jgi:hypothetical protein
MPEAIDPAVTEQVDAVVIGAGILDRVLAGGYVKKYSGEFSFDFGLIEDGRVTGVTLNGPSTTLPDCVLAWCLAAG